LLLFVERNYGDDEEEEEEKEAKEKKPQEKEPEPTIAPELQVG
jgi:hypothetical protein